MENREQIKCPYVEKVKSELEGLAKFRTCPEYIKNALALINKQETEYNELYELCKSYRKELGEVKADTVRKMQERLKEAPIKVGLPLFGLQTKDEVEDYANELILQMRDAIDQIAKEMVEGANNG